MWSKKFWRDAVERAIKSGSQGAIAALGTVALLGDINWVALASGALIGAVTSLLTSVASARVGESGSASALPSRESDWS